ncbi:MAG TPA: hypothetical protein VNW71_23400 [Thermoanaerobaculia bacterium]|nr:hypothetical protein [Thermoanaerobaculia bacterium]
MHPIEFILGAGAHVQLRQIMGIFNRPYDLGVVGGHATALVAAGYSQVAAARLLRWLCHHAATAAALAEQVALARALRVAGWHPPAIDSSVVDYRANANGHTGAQWGAVGAALAVDQDQQTTLIARLAGWNPASTLLLAQAFTANNPNGFPMAWWCALATQLGANHPAETAAFARINGWGFPAVTALAASYLAANPHGFSAAQWATLASRAAVDQHATALATMVGWNNFASVDTLAANRAANNPNNFSVAEWIAIGGAAGNNDAVGTTALARLTSAGAAAWTHPHVLALAQGYAAGNPNNLTATEWTQIAAALAADSDAQAIALARVTATAAAVWTFAPALALAQGFQAGNANNLSAADWTALAAQLPADQHANVTAFARVRGRGNTAWTAAPAAQLVQAFAANPGGFSAAQWVAIANVVRADQHANVTTFAQIGWAHARIVTLATLFGNNAFNQTAADWRAVAARMNFGAWAAYTVRAMQCRGRGWPDQVMIGGVAWNVEGSNDGIVFRLTGAAHPHITLHNLDESPDNWWQHGGNFHVVTVDVGSPFDYARRDPNQFHAPHAAPPAIPGNVTAIANSFCTALGH